MRFKEYLEEAQYKTQLKSVSEAWELAQVHCKDALRNQLKNPIVRGMSGFHYGVGILQGDAGGRKSRNTTNHYTVILDAILPARYPRRSASIICANWENRWHADGYGGGGGLHAILPYDGVNIAVCPGSDIWDTEIRLAGRKHDNIEDWNHRLRGEGVHDRMSFDEMMDRLEARRRHPESEEWLQRLEAGKIKEAFAQAYFEPFDLTTTANPTYNDGGSHELWIGGKCVAINLEMYEDMVTTMLMKRGKE